MEPDFYALGRGIGLMESGRNTALKAATAPPNIALLEQLGKITREIEVLERMVRQMAIDWGTHV